MSLFSHGSELDYKTSLAEMNIDILQYWDMMIHSFACSNYSAFITHLQHVTSFKIIHLVVFESSLLDSVIYKCWPIKTEINS